MSQENSTHFVDVDEFADLSSIQSTSNKRRRIQKPSTNFVHEEDNFQNGFTIEQPANNNVDEFDAFGIYVAYQLRNMTNESQSIYVQKMIADSIFYGRLGKLSESSTIELNRL